MQEAKTDRLVKKKYRNKSLLIVLVLIVAIGIGVFANNFVGSFQEISSMPKGPGTLSQLSQSDLEEQYGLRVNLVAVTAGGGMVDVRLKIIDGGKAKSLLQDPDNFPALWIADNDISLAVPRESTSQEIKFENDSILFVLFPNARGIVKPGTPVVIRFGDIQVETMPAK